MVLNFDGAGQVQQRLELTAGGEVAGVEIDAGLWHTLVALKPGTVLFEVRQGPYSPLTDKDFAAWAPPEGEAEAGRFVQWFHEAQAGDRMPRLRRSRGC